LDVGKSSLPHPYDSSVAEAAGRATPRARLRGGDFGAAVRIMNPQRLLLYVLTALAGVGALYFWAIHVVAAAVSLLIIVLVLVVGVFFVRRRHRQ